MKNYCLFFVITLVILSCKDETVNPVNKPPKEDSTSVSTNDTTDTISKDTTPLPIKKDTIQFTLYLNYITSIESCKTFKIRIDGQEKYTEELCFKGITPCAKTFVFPISCENHTIKTEIIGESAILEKTVEFINTKKFGYINYYSNTSTFNFYLSLTGGLD